jgi:hypothetical protein
MERSPKSGLHRSWGKVVSGKGMASAVPPECEIPDLVAEDMSLIDS